MKKTKYRVRTSAVIIALSVILGGQSALASAVSSVPLATTKIVSASTVTIDGFEYSKEVKEALDHLNKRRAEMGLNAVKIDPFLTKAAQNHADYLATNSEYSHEQNKNKKGFTGKTLGDRIKSAGGGTTLLYHTQTEVISSYLKSADALDSLISAPYHRVMLLDSNAEYIGVGVATDSKGNPKFVVTGASRGADSNSIIYPYDGQINVPTAMNKGEESPDPVADAGLTKSGFVLSYVYYGQEKKLSPTLKDSKGNKVELVTKSWIAPSVLIPSVSDGRSLFIIPKTELKTNETYTLTIDGKTSTFTTNKKAGSYKDLLGSASSPTLTPTPKPPVPNEKAPRTFSVNDVGIRLDGKYIDVNPRAKVVSGSTYIPLRGVLEAMGARVIWDNEQGTLHFLTSSGKQSSEKYTGIVHITKDNTSIDLYIGTSRVDIQGKRTTLSSKPFVEKGTTYVPLRFISETLGAKVTWDNKNYTVGITTN